MIHPEITRYLAGMQDRMDYYREIIAIRRMGLYDVSGRRICYAFGCDGDELLPLARTFLFDIEVCQETGELDLTIDAYTANRVVKTTYGYVGCSDDPWDVDQWEAKRICLSTDATRDGFRRLARIARVVIKGGTVKICSGRVSLDGFVADTAEARP